jgi:hypothetical protein
MIIPLVKQGPIKALPTTVLLAKAHPVGDPLLLRHAAVLVRVSGRLHALEPAGIGPA